MAGWEFNTATADVRTSHGHPSITSTTTVGRFPKQRKRDEGSALTNITNSFLAFGPSAVVTGSFDEGVQKSKSRSWEENHANNAAK